MPDEFKRQIDASVLSLRSESKKIILVSLKRKFESGASKKQIYKLLAGERA